MNFADQPLIVRGFSKDNPLMVGPAQHDFFVKNGVSPELLRVYLSLPDAIDKIPLKPNRASKRAARHRA